jgi:hypothetical protein
MEAATTKSTMLGLFEFAYIDGDNGDFVIFEDCLLLKPVGDLPAGTRIESICFDVYVVRPGSPAFRFQKGGKEYTFNVDGFAVDVIARNQD